MHQFCWITPFSAWEKRWESDTFIFLWKVTILSKHKHVFLTFMKFSSSIFLCHSHTQPCFHPKATSNDYLPLPPPSSFWMRFSLLNLNPATHTQGTILSIITSCLTTATVIRSFYLAKNHMVLLFDRPWGTTVRLTVCCHLSVAQNGMQLSAQMWRV